MFKAIIVSSAIAIAALPASLPALAVDKHSDVDAHKPLRGGIVTLVKDIDFELVAKADAIQIYMRDHGKPIDISKATAKLTLLTGTEKQEVELKPNGDKLEAKGSYKIAAGTKAVALVSWGGKSATARFSLK
jgi:hypothetical protein